ncbi:odorant receptor 9a-like [Leptopilina boulardi]|uniref:odorant receptor 9a-like n=1 Tax=Leptopilina boulardi TaxID=63433 RepID=UPI0021F5FDBD|nr:odorant receptor 9a-like [Leptopilina boulardi]
MFLMEVVITVISLCFVMFVLLVVSPAKDIYSIFINIIYLLTPTILIFLYNYVGENLINHSIDIGVQVYNSNWEDCDPQLVQSLMLIIIRSQRPLTLTGGKFFLMSLDTFKNIMLSGWTYATFLQSIKP